MTTPFARPPLVLLFIFLLSSCLNPALEDQSIRLYVLNGGAIEISDMREFSRRGLLDGERITLANPSFLIRHPQGDLLWDSGNSDVMADYPEGLGTGVYLSRLENTLASQLEALDLTPADIEFFSLSHLHPDHAGNANLFADSTFIVHERELEYMFSAEAREPFSAFYSDLENSNKRVFSESEDVFGDGTAVIHAMPGHTPGSSVLLLRLSSAGNFLFSGDLYAHRRARTLNTVPEFNLDPAATLESRRRFEALAESEDARVVIQHSMPDFEALPSPPAFLD